MGLTKSQWQDKLKSWVPQWFFEEELNQEAFFQGFAKVLEALELNIDAHLKETFIMQAEGSFLDEHGYERNIDRKTSELDRYYAPRIQSISNTTSIPTIRNLVNELLDVGECIIREDYNSQSFFSRDTYLNRGYLIFDALYNTFSIIVNKQIHAPYTFCDREYFCSREDFLGTNESSLELFETIVEAINKAKALGVLYRLIERLE